MENPNLKGSRPKRSYRKTVLFSILIAVILFAGIITFWPYLFLSSKQRALREAVLDIEKASKADFDAAMADTYGGRTPQETLQMYIDAVEKSDYELASKYFIESKRQQELKSWENVTSGWKMEYLKSVRNAASLEGEYYKEKYFTIYNPILLDLVRYPNGIWKIIEI